MNKLKTLIIVSLFAITGNAIAVPITGEIGFAGSYSHDGTIDLSDAKTITPTTAFVLGSTTGDFAGIAQLTAVVYKAFTFDPLTVPVVDLWKVAGFSFSLANMAVDSQTASSVVLSGSGVVSSTAVGLDDADFIWEFTANSTGFSFSSGNAPVPAPGVALLMGIGLVGIGISRKVCKSA